MTRALAARRCADYAHTGSCTVYVIPEQSHLLANCLVVLLWLIAISTAIGCGWVVGKDMARRQSPMPASVSYARVS